MSYKSLLKLCSSGDLRSLHATFEPLSKTEIESIKDTQDASCLHYAARHGHTSALDYFISHKNISPFLVSKVGATCLHDAAVRGQTAVVEWILEHTDLNMLVKDNDGATPAHLAAKFDQLELIDWILANRGTGPFKEQAYNGATCLHFACASGALNAGIVVDSSYKRFRVNNRKDLRTIGCVISSYCGVTCFQCTNTCLGQISLYRIL